MSIEWKDRLGALLKSVGKFRVANPSVGNAFHGLELAARNDGELDAKTQELISLAVAVTTRCDGCITAHAAAAKKAGVSEAQLAAALGVAIAVNAGAAYVHSARALDAYQSL